ncbi:Nn.00g046600.m01.CDS01 [Neocucurbitaria sp. VM-36]
MLRNGASRLALRSIAAPVARPAASFYRTSPIQQCTIQFGSMASRRPQLPQIAQLKPIQVAIARRNITEKQVQAESKYQHEKLKPTPETVSTTSSTHPIFGEIGTGTPPKEVDMMAGVKHDVGTVKDTFSLSTVPREAYYMGLAGTLPYLATSISTVYLSWEINHANSGYGFLIDETNAIQLLQLLEPLQIGYGASILSFLGAIHWGLEWAGFGGYQGYKRYAIGVVAPAVAWSTLLMPIEGALITQFLGFVGLYYIDTRATYRGWTPPWYAVYRFVLTFIVGASLVLSLIGRGELPGHVPSAVSRAEVFHGKGDSEERLAKEEEARAAKKKDEARSDDRGEDD